MKKQIWMILLAVLLVLSKAGAVSAEETRTIPAERLLPRLVDEVDLLTEEEENSLLEKLDEISLRQDCDVVIAVVSGLEGSTAMEYADDFYDYNGYGMGSERDGILLLVSMEERDWWISTCGYGITAFTDAGMKYMSEKFLPELSDGNYLQAFEKFAGLCDDFITQAKTGEPYDRGNLPAEPFNPFWIFVDLVIGFGMGYVIAFRKKENLRTVRKKVIAEDYTLPGSFVLTVNSDRYVRKYTTSQVIKSDSESDSSGRSTHTSSSDTTHGGTGGKF